MGKGDAKAEKAAESADPGKARNRGGAVSEGKLATKGAQRSGWYMHNQQETQNNQQKLKNWEKQNQKQINKRSNNGRNEKHREKEKHTKMDRV